MRKARSKSAAPGEGLNARHSAALSRGIHLLWAFRPGETSLGVSELARRVGAPKSTVSRLLFTLAELGLLTRDGRGGEYGPTPLVLALAHTAVLNIPHRIGAYQLLERMIQDDRLIAGFGVLTETSVTYLDVRFGRAAPRLIMATGHRSSLAHTAIGWASLWAMSPERRISIMARLAEMYPSEWARLSRRIAHAITSMARDGYCIAWPSEDPDYCTIGSAFATANESIVYAFNLVVRVTDLRDRADRQHLGMKLARAVRELRLALGPRSLICPKRGAAPMPGEVR